MNEAEEGDGEGESQHESANQHESNITNAISIVEMLQKETRNICRYLYHCPDQGAKLFDLCGAKKNLYVTAFIESVQKLYKVYRKEMTTSKEEEESAGSVQEELANRTKKLEEMKKNKEADLYRFQQQKDKENKARKKEIDKLKVYIYIYIIRQLYNIKKTRKKRL